MSKNNNSIPTASLQVSENDDKETKVVTFLVF